MFHVYFKLDKTVNATDVSEELARMEIESLFGSVRPVHNFTCEAQRPPLSDVRSLSLRDPAERPVILGDIFRCDLPTGGIQGFCGLSNTVPAFGRLVRRLAYTQEIVAIANGVHRLVKAGEAWIDGKPGCNFQVASDDNCIVFRFITNQYFLDKSENAFRLSHDERELIDNANLLLSLPTAGFYQNPAARSGYADGPVEDLPSSPDETVAYLAHCIEPQEDYPSPKLVRALINIIHPSDSGMILDNSSGNGAILVEALEIGTSSSGVDRQPLSVLASNATVQRHIVPASTLKGAFDAYFALLSRAIRMYEDDRSRRIAAAGVMDLMRVDRLVDSLLEKIPSAASLPDRALAQIGIASVLVERFPDGPIRNCLRLALNGAIGNALRRPTADFSGAVGARLAGLYMHALLFQHLDSALRTGIAGGSCRYVDARDMAILPTASVDGIVSANPSIFASDQIKTNVVQLLKFDSAYTVEGIPRDPARNPREVGSTGAAHGGSGATAGNCSPPLDREPHSGTSRQRDRSCEASEHLRYFENALEVLADMRRVLKPGAMAALIITNGHFQTGDLAVEVRIDDIVRQLAERNGFETVDVVRREPTGNGARMIQYESILLLRSTGQANVLPAPA